MYLEIKIAKICKTLIKKDIIKLYYENQEIYLEERCLDFLFMAAV